MIDGTRWHLLFVDDDKASCEQVKELLEGQPIPGYEGPPSVETLSDFDQALDTLEKGKYDLIILDIRLGAHTFDQHTLEEAGIELLGAIKARTFIPVVFYTALPHLVRHLETPLVRVVDKATEPELLIDTVKALFVSGLPAVNRALIRHLERTERDYMWGFVADNWAHFRATSDGTELAHLLARRLALRLSGTGIQDLSADLGDPPQSDPHEGCVHPMRYYVMPPVEPTPLAGDVYQGQIGDQQGFWVLLTPSCDLSHDKAETVLLARGQALTGQHEFLAWQEDLPTPSHKKCENLRTLLTNKRRKQEERFHFLPGAFALPNMIVDFQQLVVIPCELLGTLNRVASLDSPFSEALVARFARYYGRLGTPDLDVDIVLSRLATPAGSSPTAAAQVALAI